MKVLRKIRWVLLHPFFLLLLFCFFIKSEIYFRSNDMSKSKASFDTAIAQDFSALGLSGRLPAYMADSRVVYNNSLERIMEQKWITMFQSAYESRVDWRRTGFLVFTTIPSFNTTGNTIPRRLSYPQIEINVNTSSLQNGPGIPVPFESLKTKVWWDQ